MTALLLPPPVADRRPGHDHLMLAIQYLGLASAAELRAGNSEPVAAIERLIVDTYAVAMSGVRS